MKPTDTRYHDFSLFVLVRGCSCLRVRVFFVPNVYACVSLRLAPLRVTCAHPSIPPSLPLVVSSTIGLLVSLSLSLTNLCTDIPTITRGGGVTATPPILALDHVTCPMEAALSSNTRLFENIREAHFPPSQSKIVYIYFHAQHISLPPRARL
jgi:hypothetical protein